MTVQVRFYTDPACPWSWAAEPALRRLMWEFESELEFVWVMGGLARSYERANLLDVVSQWLVDAAEGGMPNPRPPTGISVPCARGSCSSGASWTMPIR